MIDNITEEIQHGVNYETKSYRNEQREPRKIARPQDNEPTYLPPQNDER